MSKDKTITSVSSHEEKLSPAGTFSGNHVGVVTHADGSETKARGVTADRAEENAVRAANKK